MIEETKVPYPEVKVLSNRAYARSGCKTADEFAIFLGGVGKRSVWRWLRGEGPLGPLAELVLAEVADGWRPTRSGPRP